jgi:hypothetical protein
LTRRTLLILCAGVLLLAAAGALAAWLRPGERRISRAAVVLEDVVLPPPFIIFRTLARDVHGRVAMLSLNPEATTRHVSPLSCARVHYARGAGLCLVVEPGPHVSTNVAYIFDRAFTRRHRLLLRGVPIRARVSPDGRVASITTYGEQESPHGERVATESLVIDIASGNILAEMATFRVVHDAGPLVGPVDVSSVAFESDSDRFFATLSTATERYLAAGSIDERRLTTLRRGVANEALSPDGRHLVVKRLIAERGFWQLAVIDLRTWVERDLNQGSRSIDDQVEWLDNQHVMFHDVVDDTTAIWMLPIDGITTPRVFVRDAFSGTTQR